MRTASAPPTLVTSLSSLAIISSAQLSRVATGVLYGNACVPQAYARPSFLRAKGKWLVQRLRRRNRRTRFRNVPGEGLVPRVKSHRLLMVGSLCVKDASGPRKG